MPGYSSFIGLTPTTEIVFPFKSSVETSTLLPNVVAHNDIGNPSYTYLFKPFQAIVPASTPGYTLVDLFEVPSREYNYIKVLMCTFREDLTDNDESDFLIEYRATWNTLSLFTQFNTISQETKILLAPPGNQSQGIATYPGTQNCFGIGAKVLATTSDTIKIQGYGIRGVSFRGIYEII